ncbi:MAG: hypothetical protein H6649_04475 [Caldilineae bacterium]|nr:hypothetical protein [Caldilineae bacterium]
MKHNHNRKPTTTTSAAWHIFAMLLLAALLVGPSPSPVRAGESQTDKSPQFDCTTVTEIPVASVKRWWRCTTAPTATIGTGRTAGCKPTRLAVGWHHL